MDSRKTELLYCRVEPAQLARLTQLERESGLTRSEILREIIDRLQVRSEPVFHLERPRAGDRLAACPQ